MPEGLAHAPAANKRNPSEPPPPPPPAAPFPPLLRNLRPEPAGSLPRRASRAAPGACLLLPGAAERHPCCPLLLRSRRCCCCCCCCSRAGKSVPGGLPPFAAQPGAPPVSSLAPSPPAGEQHKDARPLDNDGSGVLYSSSTGKSSRAHERSQRSLFSAPPPLTRHEAVLNTPLPPLRADFEMKGYTALAVMSHSQITTGRGIDIGPEALLHHGEGASKPPGPVSRPKARTSSR